MISMNSEMVLDLTALSVIRSLQQPGMENLVTKIISMFLEDSERYATEIKEAVGDINAERLGASAHSLKSTAANVGAMQVSAIAARLEMLGRTKSLDAAEPLVAELCDALAAAHEMLKVQLEKEESGD